MTVVPRWYHGGTVGVIPVVVAVAGYQAVAWYHHPTQPHHPVPLQLYNTIFNRLKTSEKSACKAALKIITL